MLTIAIIEPFFTGLGEVRRRSAGPNRKSANMCCATIWMRLRDNLDEIRDARQVS